MYELDLNVQVLQQLTCHQRINYGALIFYHHQI